MDLINTLKNYLKNFSQLWAPILLKKVCTGLLNYSHSQTVVINKIFDVSLLAKIFTDTKTICSFLKMTYFTNGPQKQFHPYLSVSSLKKSSKTKRFETSLAVKRNTREVGFIPKTQVNANLRAISKCFCKWTKIKCP